MGSFIEHCAITGLPIYEDDYAITFIVSKDERFHAPICSLPITGRMGGYGTVIMSTTESVIKEQQTVFENFFKTGMNKVFKEDTPNNLDELLQEVSKGNVYSHFMPDNNLEYSLAHIREDVFKRLVEVIKTVDLHSVKIDSFSEFNDSLNFDVLESMYETDSVSLRGLSDWQNSVHRYYSTGPYCVQSLSVSDKDILYWTLGSLYTGYLASSMLECLNKHTNGNHIQGVQSIESEFYLIVSKLSQEIITKQMECFDSW